MARWIVSGRTLEQLADDVGGEFLDDLQAQLEDVEAEISFVLEEPVQLTIRVGQRKNSRTSD